MIEVKPVQEKEEQAKLCALGGVAYDADLLMYAAYVDEQLVACCQFGMPKAVGLVADLFAVVPRSAAVEEALFIMGRAALNFIDLCGVHEAYTPAPKAEDELLMRKIGFKQTEDNKWYMNLEGFFATPCSHH